MAEITKTLQAILIAVIKTYQKVLSPFMVNRCRFYPSCSEYSLQAIRIHGPLKGLWLATKRISRCHPFHPGGIDQVPHKHN